MIKLDENKEILKYLPLKFWNAFDKLNEYSWENLNEISFICGQALTVKVCGKRSYLGSMGITFDIKQALIATKNDLLCIYELITESSAYAFNRFINDGFLTLKGGHRVGISGNYICIDNKVTGINSINTVCFRISHKNKYDFEMIYEEIYKGNRVFNTIIISPPGCGKTTLLRGIVSYISTLKKDNNILKCVLVDERCEIASCYEGEATMNVGNVTSVISECNKSIAIPISVRSLSPDVVAVDELASEKDIESIKYAQASGCRVIATTHGFDETLNKLTYYNYKGLFEKFIILSDRNGPGTIEKLVSGENI